MKSLKFKLGLVVSIIMLLAFIIIFIYYNAILNERVIKTSVQLLSKTAAKYESDLINEIEISKERGDLLARIFLKKIKEGSLDQDTEK
jgi:hypothetical protein